MSNTKPYAVRGTRLQVTNADGIVHRTKIELAEYSDGDIAVAIITTRDGKEDLLTNLKLCPATFTLLSDALFRAAHDPSVWVTTYPVPEDAGDESGS